MFFVCVCVFFVVFLLLNDALAYKLFVSVEGLWNKLKKIKVNDIALFMTCLRSNFNVTRHFHFDCLETKSVRKHGFSCKNDNFQLRCFFLFLLKT